MIFESEIAHIGGGEVLTTSLVIAEGVGRQHKNILELIRDNQSDFDEFGLVAFETRPRYEGQHGGGSVRFALLNEQQATLLMTYMRNSAIVREFKKRLVKEFYRLSKRKETPSDLSRMEILQIAMAAEEEKIALQGEVKILAPKAEALDRIATSDGSFCISNAAKDLQVRPKDLFSWLSANKWIYRRTGNSGWLGYQDKTQRGLLEHKVMTISRGDGSEKVTEQVRVTSKGMCYLAINMLEAV